MSVFWEENAIELDTLFFEFEVHSVELSSSSRKTFFGIER